MKQDNKIYEQNDKKAASSAPDAAHGSHAKTDKKPNKGTAVLLAVYNPNEAWLAELLDSLNGQTCHDLCLYVRDDASTSVSPERLNSILRTHITAFPFVLNRNSHNLGSNRTFEALIRDCSEEFIAFCDQDDVWLPDKLQNSLSLLQSSPLSPTLICTDVRVIDGNGAEISPSMKHHRHRHVFLRGTGLASQLFFRNFVIGCTVVMRRERALSYLPLPDGIVHDHYLAFRAACDGALDYLEQPQMLYRVYGGNQTGVMTGVTTKEDYYRERIAVFAHRMEVFSEYTPKLPELADIQAWCRARVKNYRREAGSFRELYRLRAINPTTTAFELYALRMPNPLFRLAVRAIQRRMV